jgi:hypothetical protein
MGSHKCEAGIVAAIARHQAAELSIILYDIHAAGDHPKPYSINHDTDGVEAGVISCTILNISMITLTAEIRVSKVGGGVMG